jgi:AcrR family transcriptional regulator
MIGLRERKKQRTRQDIYAAARALFDERGFDGVTVGEIADAAGVSEVTVFNHFPTKEDLFYEGMRFFEEQLVEAVRDRARGEPAIRAFRRAVLSGAENLAERGRAGAIVKAGRVIAASPGLAAREREIVEAHTRRLGELLAAETGADPGDVEPFAAAAAMMAVHRSLVEFVRRRVNAGRRGSALAEEFHVQATRAFGRLARGLGGYAPRV